MKSFLCLLLLLSVGCSVNAQLEKGRHFAGMQATLLNSDIYATKLAISSDYPEKEYGISLVPTYGWAAARNWLIGAQATIGYTHLTTTYNSYQSVSQYYDFGIAPFTRFYLDLASKGRFKAFGMAALEIATVLTKNAPFDNFTNGGYHARSTDVVGTIGGGLAYFTKKNLSLDLNISGAGIRFGVYQTFGGKKMQ